MKKTLQTLSFGVLLIFISQMTTIKAQPMLNTSWDAAGILKTTMEGTGIDTLRMIFKSNNLMQFKYRINGKDTIGNAVWWQVDTNTVAYYDTSGVGIGMACDAADTQVFQYTIFSDFMKMDSISDGCLLRASNFTQSQWKKTGSLLSIKDTRSGILSLSVYPNPTTDILFIAYPHINGNFEVLETCIYNLMGEKVKTISGKRESIDVKTLNSGTYLICVTSLNGMVSTARFDILH